MKKTREQKAYDRGYSEGLKRAERIHRELAHLKNLPKNHPPSDNSQTIEFCLNGAETLLKAAAFLMVDTDDITTEESQPQTPE